MQRFWNWLAFALPLVALGWGVYHTVAVMAYCLHFDSIKSNAERCISRAAIATRPEEMEKQLADAQASLQQMPEMFDVWLDVVDDSGEQIHQLADGTRWKESIEDQVAAIRASLHRTIPNLQRARPPGSKIGLLVLAMMINICAVAGLFLLWAGRVMAQWEPVSRSGGCP